MISASHFSEKSIPTSSLKRPRNGDKFSSLASSSSSDEAKSQRRIVGSKHVSATLVDVDSPITTLAEPAIGFSLPLHSSELGRLPIYEPFDWEQWAMSESWNASTFDPISTTPSSPSAMNQLETATSLFGGQSDQDATRTFYTPDTANPLSYEPISGQLLSNISDNRCVPFLIVLQTVDFVPGSPMIWMIGLHIWPTLRRCFSP